MNNISAPLDAGEIICADVSWFDIHHLDLSSAGTGVTLGYSNNITIANNSCSNCAYGVFLYSSNDCLIENNECSSSADVGIYIYGTDNVARGNTIANCRWGILLPGSSGNYIYHNNIINNTYQVSAHG